MSLILLYFPFPMACCNLKGEEKVSTKVDLSVKFHWAASINVLGLLSSLSHFSGTNFCKDSVIVNMVFVLFSALTLIFLANSSVGGGSLCRTPQLIKQILKFSQDCVPVCFLILEHHAQTPPVTKCRVSYNS